MSMLKTTRTLLIGVLLCSGTMALAVGDPPRRLDRREAGSAYSSVRSLLTNDGKVCPIGQIPLSGYVTGGGAPGTGSQTTIITFDKGAKVRIVRRWGSSTSGSQTATVQVSCDSDATTVTLNPADLPKAGKTANERCLEAETSLRVPRAGACDKIRN